MRIVKFRAYNTFTKKMFFVKAIDGRYVWDNNVDIINDSAARIIDTAHDTGDNCHLMQFIGVTAKNGPIYEGDIVHWPGFDGNTYQVCYDRWGIPALAGIKDWEGGDFKEFEMNYKSTPAKCEILGNIWENPELLKEQI